MSNPTPTPTPTPDPTTPEPLTDAKPWWCPICNYAVPKGHGGDQSPAHGLAAKRYTAAQATIERLEGEEANLQGQLDRVDAVLAWDGTGLGRVATAENLISDMARLEGMYFEASDRAIDLEGEVERLREALRAARGFVEEGINLNDHQQFGEALFTLSAALTKNEGAV